MSTPPPAVPLPPPIEPAPRGGCWKTGVIGCGAAAVVVVLLIIAAILYFSRRPEAMFDLMMTAVEANLAPEVTDEDRRELRAAYAEFRQALKEKRVDRRELENLNRVLRIRSGEPISRDRVHQMTEFFRRAARSAPAPATSPTPILVAPAP
ncbi:MAG TPA: hypothetical protein VIE39_11520 [Thermoanaerobaculia bacterium]|jgi:hypothetical protein